MLFLKGYFPWRLLLRKLMTEKKYFTLELLNQRIMSFTYGKTEARNKITSNKTRLLLKEINCICQVSLHVQSHLSDALVCKSFCFIFQLPRCGILQCVYLFIGDKVPENDSHWECFILLLEIVRYCTARTTCHSSAMYVAALIEDHHKLFRSCYPGVSLTPSMDHFPRLMLQCTIL